MGFCRPASCHCRTSSMRPAARSFRNTKSRRLRLRRPAISGASMSTSICQSILTPEFPPPIFLTTHPELGDVSRGELLTIKNFYEFMIGIITPVQMEGMRLLLTPFPQEEFNQTEDRKVADAESWRDLPRLSFEFPHQRGLSSDAGCPAAGVTLSPRHDEPARACSISKSTARNARCGRSRISPSSNSAPPTSTATMSAPPAKECICPTAPNQVAMMAQMQNIIDFPPAPKLDPFGRLDPADGQRAGTCWARQVFMGKGRCAECHIPQHVVHGQQHARPEAGAVLQDRAGLQRPRSPCRTDRSRRSRCAASRTRRRTCMTVVC